MIPPKRRANTRTASAASLSRQPSALESLPTLTVDPDSERESAESSTLSDIPTLTEAPRQEGHYRL